MEMKCDLCRGTNYTKLEDKMYMGKKVGEIHECNDCSHTSEHIFSTI